MAAGSPLLTLRHDLQAERPARRRVVGAANCGARSTASGALPAGCAVFSPQERLLILGGLCGLVQTLMLDEVSPFVHTHSVVAMQRAAPSSRSA